MISNLSSFLADKFFISKDANEDERELYVYGLFMFLSHFIYLVLVCIFGCLLKCVAESIIFYFAFYQIRRFAGGYHAKTELRCEICSLILMFLSIITIKLSCYYNLEVLFYCSLIAAIAIFIIAPLDTPEKPLSKKEFIFFRKKARINLIVIFLAATISYSLKQNILFVPCCTSIIVESFLIVAGQIKKVKMNIEKNHETISIISP